MTWYLTTLIDPTSIEKTLKYYLNINKYFLIIPDKIIKYIKDDNNIDVQEVIDLTINNTKVSSVKKDLVSIYILNQPVEDTTLESILQLIEFGNRDVYGTKQITKWMNTAISQVRRYIGGE